MWNVIGLMVLIVLGVASLCWITICITRYVDEYDDLDPPRPMPPQ